MRPRGLGRGLDALLGGEAVRDSSAESLGTLKVDQLQRGKYQPRTRMDEASLEELALSIRKQGLMQPILVRPLGAEGSVSRYEIIAGERRWKAARLAGLEQVPVVIRDVPDRAALSMALIENIQREDLNALEEAQGLQRLANEFGMSHQDIAEAIGRSRAAVTNALRLLNLSTAVQQLLLNGKLDMGHARALLALEGRSQEQAAARVAERGLSVRQTEQWVQELLNPIPAVGRKRQPAADRDVERLAEELSERFGTAVEIRQGRKGSGKLVISYTDSRHLESLLARFR
jgi:ParB family chromosome partitioning protein